jgi:hypothetical protein
MLSMTIFIIAAALRHRSKSIIEIWPDDRAIERW